MNKIVKEMVKQDIQGNKKSNLKLSEVKEIARISKIVYERATRNN